MSRHITEGASAQQPKPAPVYPSPSPAAPVARPRHRSIPALVMAAASLLALAAVVPGYGQQTFTVTNASASGPGSLDAAIDLAEADAAADVIAFAPALAGQTITLSSTLSITEALTIDGSAAPGIRISGGWDGAKYATSGVRLFFFEDSAPVTLRRLHLTGGYGGSPDNDGLSTSGNPYSNGGVFTLNRGTLTIEDCVLSNSSAFDGGFFFVFEGDIVARRTSFFGGRARDDGGVGHLMDAGTFEATECTFYGNTAGFAGGTSASSVHHGSVLQVYGDARFSHCTFAYNVGPGGAIHLPNTGATFGMSKCLLSANDNGVGYESLNGYGTFGDFGGGALDVGDGNYSDDDVLAGVNVHTTDELALGPLVYDGTGVATAAIDCRSVVRGAIASTGTDQLGYARAAGSEPGARETHDCVDRDGDGTVDYADGDDDDDGIDDATELGFVPLGSAEIASHVGTGAVPSGMSYAAGGTTVTYHLSGEAALSLDGEPGVQNTHGLKVRPTPHNATEAAVARIAFDDPVYGLRFTLADFDYDYTTAQETVEILLEDGDQLLGIPAADVSVGAKVERTGNRYACIASGEVDGHTDLTDAVVVGPLDVPVTGVRFRFTAGAAATSSTVVHQYFLSEPTFHHVDSADVDGDGLALLIDIDADGDGIVDRLEGQTTGGFSATATAIAPIDTDGDGSPDYLDADSDDDGEPDRIEAHDTNNDGLVDGSDAPVMNTGLATGADADGDGLDDGFDLDAAAYGGGFGNPGSYPDNDASYFDVDFRDVDGNVAGVVWHDSDGDGLRDTDEAALSGVTVRLLDAATDGVLETRLTGTDGAYLFANVAGGGFGNPPVGQFRIEVAHPGGGFGNPTVRGAGADPRADSDIDPADNRTAPFTIDQGNASPFTGAGFLDAPVPVDVYDQDARTDADCGVEVAWSVGTERGTAYYLVQARRTPGEWVDVDTVLAKAAPDYRTRVDAAGAYLRIVDVDADGTRGGGEVMYAPACPNAVPDLGVHPNPAGSGGELEIGRLAQDAEATLCDVTGRCLARVIGTGEAARLSLRGVPAGTYVLRVGMRSARVVVH